MTTMENPQPDTPDPGSELTAEAAEHAEIFPNAPDTENGHLERAYQLQREEDFETALQECAKAIEDIPTLAEAHNLRGLLLEQLDRPEQALEAYRRATEVDAEFEEARQNFQGLQEELREDSYRRTRVSPLKVILAGAVVYGILYILAYFIFPFSNSGVTNLLFLPVYAFIYACVIGLCAFTIGKIARFKQTLWLGIASGLGCGIAYMLTDVITIFRYGIPGVYSNYLVGFHTVAPYNTIFSGITGRNFHVFAQYAIIGAITGLCFGLVQKTKAQIIYSILAGVIGFSLQRAIGGLYPELLLSTKLLATVEWNDPIIAILYYVGSFIESSPTGALFGYVLTRYRPPALEISDLDEAILLRSRSAK